MKAMVLERLGMVQNGSTPLGGRHKRPCAGSALQSSTRRRPSKPWRTLLLMDGDISEFLELTAELRLQPQVQEYPLAAAIQTLVVLKTRSMGGAKVLIVAGS